MAVPGNKGACRIPRFGSQTQVSSQPLQLSEAIASELPSPSSEPRPHDLGKKVKVADKEGVLKYLGKVHFAKGDWCGVKLGGAVGKNDGLVDGVRYFSCPPGHGLMVPVYKVTLIESSSKTVDNNFSRQNNQKHHQKPDACSAVVNHQGYNPPDSPSPTLELSQCDLGKKVKVGNKKGVLQFVGSVHFAKGVWCGVKLGSALGKNDGIVEGVRYFRCPPLHGLMVPVSKITLIEGSCETLYKDNPSRQINQNAQTKINIVSSNAVTSQQASPSPSEVSATPSPTLELSQSELGKKVKVGDKEGVLQYVGSVHFAKGVWCGVKLESAVGKNDGFVDGVRYFSCSPGHGLMVPVSKVILTEGSCDTLHEDNASGPYSILCLDSTRTVDSKSNQNNQIQPSKSSTSVNQTFDILSEGKGLNQTTIEDTKVGQNPNNTYVTRDLPTNSTFSKKRTNDAFNEHENRNCEQIQTPTEEALPYIPINKSCENLLNESTFEVKRRRTSNPKPNLPLYLRNFDSPGSSSTTVSTSTPARGCVFDDLKKIRLSGINSIISTKNDDNKRDSLDCEESLGILTPDQMSDFTNMVFPSSEYNPVLVNNNPEVEIQSPNIASITEHSLGLIHDDQMHTSSIFVQTGRTMDLELFLNSGDNNSIGFVQTRSELTPSPEELPLDTELPTIEAEPSKSEATTQKKTNNCFINSITSITSLDTGYQGDGEMSRPASRGADNSPLTRRPFPRVQTRRPDPMTDSDFYTESDADNHEDNQLKGDRRAQVIDGTLYGVDPQAAADIYVNNRENMDSSGVFTDIESGLRHDDDVDNDNEEKHENDINSRTVDVSPSDSSKTISENSQNNLQEILEKSGQSSDLSVFSLNKTLTDNCKKRNAPSPGNSSPSSLSSPRHQSKEENIVKKYKMPKRDVTSKVKAVLESSQVAHGEKKSIKKPVGRWDAVMNKISKNEQNKMNLKEVKSKVFDNVNLSTPPATTPSRPIEQRKVNSRPSTVPNNKSRRNRTRTTTTPMHHGSIHSSLSDLSASTGPPKKVSGSTKKRDAIQVTQVLTPNKITTRNQQNNIENKKNVSTVISAPSNDISKRNLFPTKEKKSPASNKESSKPTVKGGRTSPSVRPPIPQTTRAPVKRAAPPPRAAEALAVLVQHLVFNVEAYQVPHLKRQVETFRIETENIRSTCKNFEETLAHERLKHAAAIEQEAQNHQKEITEILEKHRYEIAQITSQHEIEKEQLKLEKDNTHESLTKKHDEQLVTLRQELEKLQKSHEESLEILREENDSIREQIDEKQLELEKANYESAKLKEDYETREIKLKEEVELVKMQRDGLKQEMKELERNYEAKVKSIIDENKRLKDEYDRLLSYGDDKDIGVKEVQSLRVVLELKQNEITELRKSLFEAKQKFEHLNAAEEKAALMQARCEDLEHQIRRKSEYEHSLIQENQKLQESFKGEIHQRMRLSQYNEELQWKLIQNKEIINKVIEQAEENAFNRSIMSCSSFNEKHSASKSNLERTYSFRDHSFSNRSISLDTSRGKKVKGSPDFENNDLSPPSSPKVKGVVEKSDSVSYVLDLDESPEVVASRIIRRSFRNATPPKNTPIKSPSNKRPRMRHPLSLSASSSAINTSNKDECIRSRSVSSRTENSDDEVFIWQSGQSTPIRSAVNHLRESMKFDNIDLDDDNLLDLELPALPNEMDKRNEVLTLPTPGRLAADTAGIDSNSEDESTSSSQL